MEDQTELSSLQVEHVQESYLKEHNDTSQPADAHPIDDDILREVCVSKLGPMTLHYDLAAVQAVAVTEILPYDCEDETWVTCYPSDIDVYSVATDRNRPNKLHYYQANSVSFYDIASIALQRYEHKIDVEDLQKVMEVHTRQYLKDVHGYSGDFGGQVPNESIDKTFDPTLCNAFNHGKCNDGSVRWETEPDNASYPNIDSRGLVIEEGTHDE